MKNSYFLSLRTLLVLAFLLVLSLALIIPATYRNHNIRTIVSLDAQEGIKHDLYTLSWFLERNKAENIQNINKYLRVLAAIMKLRISYIASNGTVLIDSGVSLNQTQLLENHLQRPEILQAHNSTLGVSERYSKTLDQYLLYAACQISNNTVLPNGYLRIAKAQSLKVKTLAELRGHIGWVYLLTALLAIALASFVSRQVSTAISRVALAASTIGQQESGKRLRYSPFIEFAPLIAAFNAMAERVEADMRLITRQKVEANAILNGMQSGVIVLDDQGKIIRGNYAAQKIFPTLMSFTGHKPMEMSLLHELQQTCDTVLSARNAGNFSQNRVPVTLQDGKVFDVSIVPVEETTGLGVIMVFHDITAIKRVEEIRRDFVANVSHELRTPLTAIKGFAETLISLEKSDAQRKEFLEIIMRNANQMTTMLDELLQLSKLEHSKKHQTMVPIDPASALYSAWKSCQTPEDQQCLHSELHEDMPQVWGNFEQIVQVFRNILENALKYAPHGHARIRVSAKVQDKDLVLIFDDNGPGIPDADQARVFERFYRVEKDRSSTIRGTGLGLAICRHILRHHQGSITVQSPVPDTSSGSRFLVTLPLAEQ